MKVLDKLKERFSSTLATIKAYLLPGLTLLSAVLFLLYRREQSKSAEAEAKQLAAKERGRAEELAKQTAKAEEQAKDSRTEYEKLKDEYERNPAD